MAMFRCGRWGTPRRVENPSNRGTSSCRVLRGEDMGTSCAAERTHRTRTNEAQHTLQSEPLLAAAGSGRAVLQVGHVHTV